MGFLTQSPSSWKTPLRSLLALSTIIQRMESQIHEQTEELQTLEKAAEEAAEPEQIDEKAEQCRIESTPRAEPEDKIWLLCALIAVLVLGGAILFLQWQPKLFHPALALKIHRYLLGGLAISALLGVMRLVEV